MDTIIVVDAGHASIRVTCASPRRRKTFALRKSLNTTECKRPQPNIADAGYE
jgi:hypothetical protein